MYEGHDADDDAQEAGQEGQDHEGAGGVQVCCGGKGQRSDDVSRGQGSVSTSEVQRSLDTGRTCPPPFSPTHTLFFLN